ncbi:MAG: hypothetical protein CMN75_13155 [Spirochaeta sp.]|nr:hypothetical protein [Spirochaeta sp.]RPG07887.1 MAG: bile acid:sodium symporter family protein [Proteobacteria bacterium TMED72]
MTEATSLYDWIAPTSMFTLMFGMGLSLSLADFRRVLLRPRGTLLGTMLQLVVMPLLGLALVFAFSLDPWLAAGLMTVAALPGGLLSNMVCHIGRADTALSITLTSLSTAVAIFTLPVWIHLGFKFAGAGAGDIELPIFSTAMELALLTLFPVGLGMWARELYPDWAKGEKFITRVSAVVLLFALVINSQSNPTPSSDDFALSLWPTVLLMAAALVLSGSLSRWLRMSWQETTTITIELCVKNSVLGLFVAVQSLDSLQASVPIMVFGSLQVPVSIGPVALYNLLLRKRDPGYG